MPRRVTTGLHSKQSPSVKRQIGLAFLAPEIVAAILKGRQPAHLTAARLTRLYDLPLDWAEQRRALGFDTAALRQLEPQRGHGKRPVETRAQNAPDRPRHTRLAPSAQGPMTPHLCE